jgi:hypothetical protein
MPEKTVEDIGGNQQQDATASQLRGKVSLGGRSEADSKNRHANDCSAAMVPAGNSFTSALAIRTPKRRTLSSKLV